MSAFPTLAKLVDEAAVDAARNERIRAEDAKRHRDDAALSLTMAKNADDEVKRHRKAQVLLGRVAKLLS